MNQYSEYKDSDIKWIGMIPEHWEVRRIKTFSPVKRGASPRPIDNPIYFDDNGEYAWVRIADVTASERYLTSTTQNLSELGSSLSVKREPNDFFLSIAATVGKPIITKIKCCIHDGFVWFPKLKMNPEYLYYIFTSGQPYLGLGKMGTQLNLNTETVGGISIPVPNDEEVNQIVSFLDKETIRIDNIIATRKKQIDLLKELKSSIISRAVTKGLKPDVVMKDSGIEWIGEIPEHWEVSRLNEIGKYRKGPFGSALKVDLFVSKSANTVKVYEQQNAIRKDANLGDSYITSEYFDNVLKNFEVLAGDVIVSCAGTIGETYLLPDNIEKGIINQALMRMRLKRDNLHIYYFLYVFDFLLKEEANKSSNGSAMKNIPPFDILKKIRIPFPPLPEQQQIVTYIENKTAKIDTNIEKFQKQIDLLTEYRSSLITEAVTGKIDVRS